MNRDLVVSKQIPFSVLFPAALSALIIKNTTISYRGKWVSNDKQIARMFERWFTTD